MDFLYGLRSGHRSKNKDLHNSVLSYENTGEIHEHLIYYLIVDSTVVKLHAFIFNAKLRCSNVTEKKHGRIELYMQTLVMYICIQDRDSRVANSRSSNSNYDDSARTDLDSV